MAKGSKDEKDRDEAMAKSRENDAVVIRSELMSRPKPEPPAKKEQPAVTINEVVMERARPKKKEKGPHANVVYDIQIMTPPRKRKKSVPSIGSTYPGSKPR